MLWSLHDSYGLVRVRVQQGWANLQETAWNSQGETPHCASKEATVGAPDKRWVGSDKNCIHNLELAMRVVLRVCIALQNLIAVEFLFLCTILGCVKSIQGLWMENSHLFNHCTFTAVMSITIILLCTALLNKPPNKRRLIKKERKSNKNSPHSSTFITIFSLFPSCSLTSCLPPVTRW